MDHSELRKAIEDIIYLRLENGERIFSMSTIRFNTPCWSEYAPPPEIQDVFNTALKNVLTREGYGYTVQPDWVPVRYRVLDCANSSLLCSIKR